MQAVGGGIFTQISKGIMKMPGAGHRQYEFSV